MSAKGRLAALCLFGGVTLARSVRALKAIWLLGSILLVCTIAYRPGLGGGFLFDDFGNLDGLGATGPVHDWASFFRYVTSGHADPTGRPLALLSFLIDAHDWPASPWPFKRTNLVIHLINGALLYALLISLGRLLSLVGNRTRKAALIGCAMWLLHPLLVSTTLYVVQREAMLSATCVLLGLLFWLKGRQLLLDSGKRAIGAIVCMTGLLGFGFLGILAKANGVLLPLLALVIEACLPPLETTRTTSISYRRLLLWAAGIPSALVIGYLAWKGVSGIADGEIVSGRTWTLGQRLLSEPRVVVDYLKLLWLPRPLSNGLFNDQYVASTSLLQPLSTAFALTTVTALALGAWMLRQRQPVLAMAILFFLAGQLLESTSIPLELYYEHRNYLPALLMFWPIAWWLSQDRGLIWIKRALMIVLPLGLAFMTYLRASEWGQSDTQALLWARINPDSSRAQTYAASVEIGNEQYARAIDRLQRAISKHPAEPQLAFKLVDAYCGIGKVPQQATTATLSAIRSASQRGPIYASWMGSVLPLAQSGRCAGLTLDSIQQMADVGLENPNLHAPGTLQDLTYIHAQTELLLGHASIAQNEFKRALDLQVRPEVALSAAATLGTAGYPQLGLDILDYYETVAGKTEIPDPGMPHLHAWVLAKQNYWPQELAHLRRRLIANAPTGHASK